MLLASHRNGHPRFDDRQLSNLGLAGLGLVHGSDAAVRSCCARSCHPWYRHIKPRVSSPLGLPPSGTGARCRRPLVVYTSAGIIKGTPSYKPHTPTWGPNQGRHTTSTSIAKHQIHGQNLPKQMIQYPINPPSFTITRRRRPGIEWASLRRNSGSRASQALRIATRSCASDNDCKLG
jgi:hypothetical protein